MRQDEKKTEHKREPLNGAGEVETEFVEDDLYCGSEKREIKLRVSEKATCIPLWPWPATL